MIDINGFEVVFLVVLAVIIFGPEKLPDLARKLARIIVFLRNIANNAQESVRKELGPEYADLELRDLHPKRFIARQVAGYEDVKDEIRTVSTTVSQARADARSALRPNAVTPPPSATKPAPGRGVNFDDEAT